MTTVSPRDKDIITKSFRLLTRGVAPSTLLQQLDWDKYFNVFSSAMGDNRYINPIPQSSPATDPRYSRFMESREGGMGSMYKEVYENNVTLLTLTPSVPQFAGLLSFITNMFSPASAIIANKGRAPGLAFYMGQAATAVAFWPMQLLSISVQFLAFLTDSPKNNFYTTKTAMGAYSMAGTGVLNDLLVKLGYIDPILPSRNQQQTDPLYGLSPNYNNNKAVSDLSLLFPDVVNADGTIDLMRMIMKGTRKHRVMMQKLAAMDNELLATPNAKLLRAQQLMEEVTFDDRVHSGNPTQNFIEKEMNSVGKVRGVDEGNFTEQDSAYTDRMELPSSSGAQPVSDAAKSAALAFSADAKASLISMTPMSTTGTILATVTNPNTPSARPGMATASNVIAAIATGTKISYEDNPKDRTWAGDILDLVQTAFDGGLDAITFRVDGATGPTSDSFANSHGASPMAEKFNQVVKSANDFRFDVAGGATGSDIIDSVVNTVKEAATGALSGTVIGNIPLALVNNAFVKIADHWDGSTSNLHKENYSILSTCNYAHPFEQIMKVWTMFALFLPLVAPFSTGGSTYTSPFMVKAFCKSRSVIRTGLITQATFTFGSGDAGWTVDRKPLNLKIDFEVTDLEPLITVPIDRSISLLDLSNPAQVASRIFTDDTAYNNYLSRLTGIDYLDTVMKYSKLNRNLTGLALDLKQSISAENIAQKVNSSIFGDLSRIFSRPISR